LPAGNYTFWIQQSGSLTEYAFDFVVVPEPAPIMVSLVGLVLVAAPV
jgi:hypothetical protein